MTSKPHRTSTCHRHPTVPITGFCASCLRERLAGFDSPITDQSQELRRTKSCSGGRDAPSAASVPRRRSCEVRARSRLSDLFNINDEKKKRQNKSGNSGFDIGEEEEEEHENGNEETVRVCDGRDEVDEEETKTMKEFIDLELQNRKNAGRDLRSFWHAASVFSEKFRKWRWKHKLKKKRTSYGANDNGNGNGGVGLMRLEIEKPRARRLRETQSEVGEYGLGRRSCDTDDPSLSIDTGRISMDYDSRISFDAPRASWDGYLIGSKASHRLSPMVSVVEDEKHNVLIEENNNNNNVDSFSPGGSAQTKDYYSCRKSFDRSNSHRRKSIAEVDELKLIANAKVSPATTELFYGAKLLITEKELMDRNVKSLTDVQSDCVLGSSSKDDSDVATGASQKGIKKFQKWRKVWNMLGLVQRREDKLEEGECDAESWQKLRRVVNVQPSSESVSQKLIRSYSVSCRNPCRMAGLINGLGATEAKEDVLNGRQEFMLQRNRSARYSPNNLDTGLLRFYLTPLRSYRRSKSGKSSLKDLHPIDRSVL